MKKVVLVCLAAALTVTSAFAEIRLAGFGRAVPILLADDGSGDLKAGRAVSWGHPSWGGDYNLGFVVEGRTNYAGFYFDVGFKNLPSNSADYEENGGTLQKYTTADQAKVWVKPFDILTISAGRVLDKNMRGDLCYGMFDWLRSGAGRLGEGLTFSPFHKIGLYLTLTPMKELYIFAGVPMDELFKNNKNAVTEAKYVYSQIQGGVGYKFNGVGILKAQYIGAITDVTFNSKEYTNHGALEAAFDFIGVENLKITVGGHVMLADNDIIKMYNIKDANSPFTIKNDRNEEGKKNEMEHYVSLGVEYKFKVAKLDAIFRTAFNPNQDLGIYFGVGSTFFLPKAWEVVADIRFQNERCEKENGKNIIQQRSSLSFLVGIQKQIPGGVFGIGFMGATNGVEMSSIENTNTSKDGSFIWAIPLRMEYRF